MPAGDAAVYVDYADCWIRFALEEPPEHLVARLHLVAVTSDGHVVVCRSAEGGRFLPGGTREPGESLVGLARRELHEEAGAVLIGDVRCFASHVADSQRPGPFRSHLPHPRSHWAYAVVDVRLAGPPGNPADGETVVEVLALEPAAAVEWLSEEDPLHADIVRRALEEGLLGA